MTMARTARPGELERAVLDRLWSAGPGRWFTVREVHESLATGRDIAYTTVMTVMDRLAKKGLVRQQREGRAYRYQAAASRGVLTAGLMREALEEYGEPHDALVAFVAGADADERKVLREALADLDGE
jgi:predicted transcriptional regulator